MLEFWQEPKTWKLVHGIKCKPLAFSAHVSRDPSFVFLKVVRFLALSPISGSQPERAEAGY